MIAKQFRAERGHIAPKGGDLPNRDAQSSTHLELGVKAANIFSRRAIDQAIEGHWYLF